jgi:serine acetyltransferase
MDRDEDREFKRLPGRLRARIGRGARVGGGTVSIPNRATLVGAPNRLLDRPSKRGNDDEQSEVEHSG